MTLSQIILSLILLGLSGLSILLVIGRPGPKVRKKKKKKDDA
ncbi:MAG: hypothetical protein AAGA15_09985 [Pseudomonadota bacterium]